MKLLKLAPLIVAGLTLSACVDDPVQPDLRPEDAPLLSVGPDGQEVPRRHLLVFNGKAPADLDARVAKFGGQVALNHPIGIAVVTGVEPGALATLQKEVRAAFAEPAPTFELVEPAAIGTPTLAALDPASQDDPTSAILYADQWNMHQINAEAAWAAGRLGDPGVTIAILDTGIDYLLPDLAGRVDLSRSVSFEPLDDLYAAVYYPGRHPSTDLHYHGTNVATQASSNAWAYAGVTSKTTLMSVKVCSFLGGCSGVAEGILHAVDNGADVINMSLGGWFAKSAFPGAVAAYNRIMNYAKQQGVTVVVSAGNDSNDLDTHKNIAIKDAEGNVIDRAHIPSFFSTYCDATHVICVSATRRGDVPASYTNYGRSAIDVAAPGGDSGDWVYSLCPQTSLVFFCEDGYYTLGVAGTSQAAPHVAGLAALAVEDVGRNVARVRAYIRNSAHRVPGQGGNSPYYGKGRIDVGAAVGAN